MPASSFAWSRAPRPRTPCARPSACTCAASISAQSQDSVPPAPALHLQERARFVVRGPRAACGTRGLSSSVLERAGLPAELPQGRPRRSPPRPARRARRRRRARAPKASQRLHGRRGGLQLLDDALGALLVAPEVRAADIAASSSLRSARSRSRSKPPPEPLESGRAGSSGGCGSRRTRRSCGHGTPRHGTRARLAASPAPVTRRRRRSCRRSPRRWPGAAGNTSSPAPIVWTGTCHA